MEEERNQLEEFSESMAASFWRTGPFERMHDPVTSSQRSIRNMQQISYRTNSQRLLRGPLLFGWACSSPTFEKPSVRESDGTRRSITPTEATLRSLNETGVLTQYMEFFVFVRDEIPQEFIESNVRRQSRKSKPAVLEATIESFRQRLLRTLYKQQQVEEASCREEEKTTWTEWTPTHIGKDTWMRCGAESESEYVQACYARAAQVAGLSEEARCTYKYLIRHSVFPRVKRAAVPICKGSMLSHAWDLSTPWEGDPMEPWGYFVLGRDRVFMRYEEMRRNLPFCFSPRYLEIRCGYEDRFRSTSTVFLYLDRKRRGDSSLSFLCTLPYNGKTPLDWYTVAAALGCPSKEHFLYLVWHAALTTYGNYSFSQSLFVQHLRDFFAHAPDISQADALLTIGHMTMGSKKQSSMFFSYPSRQEGVANSSSSSSSSSSSVCNTNSSSSSSSSEPKQSFDSFGNGRGMVTSAQMAIRLAKKLETHRLNRAEQQKNNPHMHQRISQEVLRRQELWREKSSSEEYIRNMAWNMLNGEFLPQFLSMSLQLGPEGCTAHPQMQERKQVKGALGFTPAQEVVNRQKLVYMSMLTAKLLLHHMKVLPLDDHDDLCHKSILGTQDLLCIPFYAQLKTLSRTVKKTLLKEANPNRSSRQDRRLVPSMSRPQSVSKIQASLARLSVQPQEEEEEETKHSSRTLMALPEEEEPQPPEEDGDEEEPSLSFVSQEGNHGSSSSSSSKNSMVARMQKQLTGSIAHPTHPVKEMLPFVAKYTSVDLTKVLLRLQDLDAPQMLMREFMSSAMMSVAKTGKLTNGAPRSSAAVKKGLTQMLIRKNQSSVYAQQSRVLNPLKNGNGNEIHARMVQNQVHSYCSSDTPDSELCGLNKNMALFSQVSHSSPDGFLTYLILSCSGNRVTPSLSDVVLEQFTQCFESLSLPSLEQVIRASKQDEYERILRQNCLQRIPILVNGRLVGYTRSLEDAHFLRTHLVRLRRQGFFDYSVGISLNVHPSSQRSGRFLMVSTHRGRLLAPAVVAPSSQTDAPWHPRAAAQRYTVHECLRRGVLEYIDKDEEQRNVNFFFPGATGAVSSASWLSVSPPTRSSQLRSMTTTLVPSTSTHLPIHPYQILSFCSAQTPSLEHNALARNQFDAAQSKQAISANPSLDVHFRFDTKCLYAPFSYSSISSAHTLKWHRLGFADSVQHVLTVFSSLTGFGIEDAFVQTLDSVQYGQHNVLISKTYMAEENFSSKQRSMETFGKIPAEHCLERQLTDDSALDKDGLPFRNSVLSGRNKIIGKHVELSAGSLGGGAGVIMSESQEASRVLYSDVSTQVSGKRDLVTLPAVLTNSLKPMRAAKVRTEALSVTDVGDKTTRLNAQKAVFALLLMACNVAWVGTDGLRPDCQVDPYCFTRMTISDFLESLFASVSLHLPTASTLRNTSFVHAWYRDMQQLRASHAFEEEQERLRHLLGEQFSLEDPVPTKLDALLQLLRQLGMMPYGHARMYDPYDGHLLGGMNPDSDGFLPGSSDGLFFVGLSENYTLGHLVIDKQNVRSTGTTQIINGQPTASLAAGGGTRFGSMERDAVVSYGASHSNHERVNIHSDLIDIVVCSKCGNTGVFDRTCNKASCTNPHCSDGIGLETIQFPKGAILIKQELFSLGIRMSLETRRIDTYTCRPLLPIFGK